MYIGIVKPIERRFSNQLELFNEWLNMLATYNFFLFTDFVDSMETQYTIGWMNILIVTILIFVNMLIILISTVSSVIRHQARKKRKRENLEREQKFRR